MNPLAPWFGLWAASIAAGRSTLDYAERMLDAGGRDDARSRDRARHWATPNEVVLELPTMRLRAFAQNPQGSSVILVAPYALHAATTADFAPGHSVVEALLTGGVGRILLTDWRSAGPAQASLGIDACLADLNVAVDEIGAPASLVGLCQGGWLAAAYAARFPAKVSRVALAGAPLDLDAAPSTLRDLVRGTSPEMIREMIAVSHGVMLGQATRSAWLTPEPDPRDIARLLQVRTAEPGLANRFREWSVDIVDLPGTFYRDTAERIFRDNLLAKGTYPALGRAVGLRDIVCPLHLLVSRDDEIVPPGQSLALADRSKSPERPTTRLVGGPHLSLFMGKATLRREWRRIAAFLTGNTRPMSTVGSMGLGSTDAPKAGG